MGPRVQTALIKTSALMKGFVVNDYRDRFPEGTKQLAEWVKSGQLQYEETITEGFERIPEAFLGLFEGKKPRQTADQSRRFRQCLSIHIKKRPADAELFLIFQ